MIAVRHAGRPQHTRTRSTQHGQALVEFTFFIFFAILPLLAGVTDVALLLDAHIAGIYAARQGARTGSVIGAAGSTVATPNTNADCAIVGAVHSVLVNQPNLTITEITIYKAGPTGQPSTGVAQYYVGTADCQNGQIMDTNAANCTPPATSCSTSALPGSNWDAASRNVTPYQEDTIGVKIDYSYTFQFDILGSGPFPTSDYAAYPMNPSPN
ncbi:MAG TPA: TadE family protein [Ktedonobacterales bacterium]|nr:TadE family protein [Ktedonobacterales bacterium]